MPGLQLPFAKALSMNKTVLITGASSGIGRATASTFAQRGWNVAATMRRPQDAGSIGEGVACMALDVTDPVSIERAIEATLARFGRIDVLVNNAGFAVVGPFEAATPEQIQREFDTNVLGLMRVTQAVLPHFRAQRSGTIVNISSIGGRLTFLLYSIYHATKWAVEGFTESLRYELEPFDIRVRLVEPGAIKTDFYDRSMAVVSNDAYSDLFARGMRALNQAGAAGGSPMQVAATILRASTDRGWRLRYPVHANLLWLRALLPYGVYHALMRRAVLGR